MEREGNTEKKLRPGGEGPLLNMEMVHELIALDQGEGMFFAELVDEFLTLAEEMIGQIEAACRSGDAPGYRGATHTLKGAGLNIGARALGEHCRWMEKRTPEAGGEATHRLRWLFDETRAAFVRLRPQSRS